MNKVKPDLSIQKKFILKFSLHHLLELILIYSLIILYTTILLQISQQGSTKEHLIFGYLYLVKQSHDMNLYVYSKRRVGFFIFHFFLLLKCDMIGHTHIVVLLFQF